MTQSIMLPRSELSLAEFETLTSISRATTYRMIERGELHTVKRGRRRLVPVEALNNHPISVKPPEAA